MEMHSIFWMRRLNETTSNYNLAETQIVGSPNPDFTGGFNNYFEYTGFDLNVLISFVYGNMVYNGAGVYQSANGDWFDNQTVDQMNRWQNPGDITDVPQARLGDGNGNKESSRYLSDASYIRFRNINLGYTLPKTSLVRMKMSSRQSCMSAFRIFTPYQLQGMGS